MDMKSKILVMAVMGAALWGGLVLSAQAGKTTAEPVYTAAQAARGEAVYTKNCIECHLRDLTGGNPEAAPAPALTGNEFTSYWNGKSIDGVWDSIRMNMPKSDPGTITPEQSADILAYIISFNKGPSGSTELPPQADVLKSIKFKF